MRYQFFVIILLSFIAYFLFQSIGFGQQAANIQAVVPLTPENVASTIQALEDKQNPMSKPKVKENKYLYYFQKTLDASQNETDSALVQTAYDKYASYGFMLGILFICAIFLVLILRLLEHWLNEFKKHVFKYKKI